MKRSFGPSVLCGLLWLVPSVETAAQFTAIPAQYQLQQVCGLGGVGALDVTIPDDGNVYQITGNATCGLVTVLGKLQCAPGVNAVVKADGFMIMGPNARLTCGTAANPFNGDVTFTLKNDRGFPGHPDHGERGIVVMGGGTLELHGQDAKAGFTRLTQDAAAGQRLLHVEDASGWEAGDQIIVTTTSTYFDQTELRTLEDNCPSNTCAITTALGHFHYGSGQQTYPGAGSNGSDLTVDLRAYVANVKRNIRIQGANDVHWLSANPKGGHVMVMDDAFGYIDSVEFNRMGQEMILGRYPLHWHHAGLVPGQYLRNSAIRNSASRCVALHNTHRIDVSDNLCYKVQGHAIFLENGNEIENTITGNLIADVLAPAVGDNLLQSDIDIEFSRWRGSAGIWVANPNNTIRDNVVVNAGTGYWHPYVHKLLCYDDPLDVPGSLNPTYGKFCNHVDRSEPDPSKWNVRPVKTLTRLYQDNVAVATRVGHTWDGAPDGAQIGTGNEFNRDLIVTGYAPGSLQSFDGMHAYRSGRTGIYYRGLAQTAHITNAVVVEAPIGWFGTGNQNFFDSVFVGVSAAYRGSDPADADWYYHVDPAIPGYDRGGVGSLYKGWGLYDGSNHFKHVTFDYPASPLAPMYFGTEEITPVPIEIFGRAHFANHILEQIHFVNDPYRRISLDAQNFGVNWKDVEASESIRDIDGSLFGSPGFIRPNIDFNELPGDCVVEVNNADADPNVPESNVLRCAGKTQSIKFQMASFSQPPDFQEFTVRRLDTSASVSPPAPDVLFDKFQMNSGTATPLSYRVENLNFKSGTIPPYTDDHSGSLIWIETFDVGDWTPLIIIEDTATNLASSCDEPSDYELEVWPAAPPGAIHEATTAAEIRSFNNPAFVGAYFQHPTNGSLVLKLRGTEPLAGNPNAFQHKAQGRFDLVCP